MPVTLAIDFGSTYTKLVAVDLDGEELIAVVQSPSTVADDVTVGLERALDRLEATRGVKRRDIGERVACSSAAGGLGMVAIGLVPELTAEAARRAALGAGARVLRVFAYELSRRDLEELGRLRPDIVLLAGGTDGGDRKTICQNARALAALGLDAPAVVAGNRVAQDEVESILRAGGVDVHLVDNVLPELGRLEVDPAREAIRRIFMERITHAKGLDRAETFAGRIVMPTPRAVLEGATLLADGTADERGLGELVVVDVGGATTDVHSVASGCPTAAGMVSRGLPEPYAKRTVEGDLGIRINARTIVETVGVERFAATVGGGAPASEVARSVERLAAETAALPGDDRAHDLDTALARHAVALAVARHAGRVETVYTPTGAVQLVRGKDLSGIATVLGTGGVFAFGRSGRHTLEAARADPADPTSLRPRAPALRVDARYALFAAGLLAPLAPAATLRILKRSVGDGGADGQDV